MAEQAIQLDQRISFAGGPLSENFAEFGRGDLRQFLAAASRVIVVFIPFFKAARVIAGDRLWQAFFVRPTAADVSVIGEVAGTKRGRATVHLS